LIEKFHSHLHRPGRQTFHRVARIALAARHVAYGEDLVYSGPIYDSMTVEGNKIRIKFKNIGGGLTLGTPPPTATGKNFSTPPQQN